MTSNSPDHDTPSSPGILISNDINIDIEWDTLAQKITEVIGLGFLSAFGIDGISGSVSALVSASNSIKINSPPGQKAWHIILYSLAWSMDNVIPNIEYDKNAVHQYFGSEISETKRELSAADYFIDVHFVENPSSNSLYKKMRDGILSNFHLFSDEIKVDNEDISFRIDSEFNRAVFAIFLRNPSTYKEIFEILKSPSAISSEREMNWIAYRQKLISDFEVKATFGQEQSKIPISKFYISLRAFWKKDDFHKKSTTHRYYLNDFDIGMLDIELEKWLNNNSEDDYLRLLGGGPGSGKSTSLRAFARKIAEDQKWRPLFVPLQHIYLEGDLRDSINKYFTDQTNGSFTQAPLSRVSIESGAPIVIIFDGLDELARPGEGANEIVNLFSTKLANLVASIRGDGARKSKIIVSGRMPAFQAAKRFLSPKDTGCLEVFGYAPNSYDHDTLDELWKLDQRPLWWQKYSSLIGLPTEAPDAFSSEKLTGITHEPLLCYLLVLSGYATENWEMAAENPNRIYRNLIDSIWNRGWGEGSTKRQGPGRTLSKEDFNSLMQTIALAAWRGGDTRVASEKGFLEAIEITRAESEWENFTADNGADVANLAMNFYLKASEGSQRGFEFTHKSFGDYLTARAILDFAIDLPDIINRRVDLAMTEWVKATGSGRITYEILTFLRDEVRLLEFKDGNDEDITHLKLSELKKSFETLNNGILNDGLPTFSSEYSWRHSEIRQINAESCSWCVVNSISLFFSKKNLDEKYIHVKWPDQQRSFSFLIQRLSSTQGDVIDFAVMDCFSYIVAPNSYFFGMNLSEINLYGAKLEGSFFNCCILFSADLQKADLRSCDFERAMLDGANFQGADLSGAVLIDARLEGTKFADAVMKDILVSYETLLYADLRFFRRNIFDKSRRRPYREKFEIKYYEDRIQKISRIYKKHLEG